MNETYAITNLTYYQGCNVSHDTFWNYNIHSLCNISNKICEYKNVNDIFTDQNLTYFIFTRKNGTFYNGIIHTTPKNPIIHEMLLKSMEIQPINEYYFNLKYGTKIIQNYILSSRIKQGINITKDYTPNIMIFYEEFFDKSYCNNKTDRYGFCTFVVDESNKPIIQIRDHMYTPNYI